MNGVQEFREAVLSKVVPIRISFIISQPDSGHPLSKAVYSVLEYESDNVYDSDLENRIW